MALTQRQQELIGAIAALKRPKTPYWNMFTKAKAPYMALSNVIRFDEVMNSMIEAGIVPRGTALPSIKVDGHSTVTVKPDIVGGSVGISALDTLNANAGETIIVDGVSIKASKYDEDQKLQTLKYGIENAKEKMAAQALLTGKVQMSDGEVDLGLNPVSDVTKTEKTYIAFFTKIVNEYFQATGYYPSRLLVGAKVIDGIIYDISANTKGPELYSIAQTEDGGMKITIAGLAVVIEGFPINSVGFDTSDKVFIVNDASMLPVYAGLEFIGTTGSPEMVRADIVTDVTDVNKETGNAKMFAKSAPFPAIALPSLFKRYRVV
ncbi:MAG: major capsid protein [Fusobacteriaceae bacterium]